MRLHVGPVSRTSALRWVEWAETVLGECPDGLAGAGDLPDGGPPEFDRYLQDWRRMACDGSAAFQWQAEVDPDALAYFTHALYNLDRRLSAQVERGEREAGPTEAHAFNLILVRALLDALAHESPCRAAFAEELRSSWPSAVEAR